MSVAKRIAVYRCIECGMEYEFEVPNPDIPWNCYDCGGMLVLKR